MRNAVVLDLLAALPVRAGPLVQWRMTITRNVCESCKAGQRMLLDLKFGGPLQRCEHLIMQGPIEESNKNTRHILVEIRSCYFPLFASALNYSFRRAYNLAHW